MKHLFDLSGKTALVTGSGGGLGLVMARGLAEYGARVILHGRDARKVDDAVTGLRRDGLSADGCTFDITDADAIALGVEAITANLGPVDILVNNAGMQLRTPLEEFPEDGWDRIFATNLKAPWLVAKAVVGRMIERQAGKIINICSIQSELGRPTITPYATSKGGLKMLTKGMAVEWAQHNIQVNGIGPGYFKTELTRALWEDEAFDQWLRDRTPANRWGDPKELVGALQFLASDASSYVNGQIIYVDGGLLASV
ncbi:MAG: SDR family oxidoreductase [Xanthomonadales bacterium]|nr:SDR family oxidoreductase [Xanthomonadales bacterium]